MSRRPLGHHRGGQRLGRTGDRGAVIVELALVSLFLLMMIAGTFDYGQGWRTGLAVNEGARAGARVGSALGPDPLADYYALSAARSSMASSGQLNGVERVVIYRSTTTNGAVPSSCTIGSASTSPCVVIDGDDFRAFAEDDFDDVTGCLDDALVDNWCPASRTNVQLTADYFGIWIDLTHTKTFTFTGSTLRVTRDAVMRLEPRDIGS